MNEALYDFIAIGVGPCNLGLACLTAPLSDVRSLFLERKPAFCWHPGMLLDGTTLQNPFLADLVSMADPTSSLSYLNYCKQQGRLYTYYIRENWYLDRQDSIATAGGLRRGWITCVAAMTCRAFLTTGRAACMRSLASASMMPGRSGTSLASW